ncbi:MAG: hypothetical protein L6R39_005346 [Caloplaca ligustica]|nr:MAG: hypothetical protein L6R39_005346 [Caloplaca ligustica]
MAATHGYPTPASHQDCTLYFYLWPCGHRQWAKCTKCNLNEPTDIDEHLGHQHTEKQLSEPKRRCPECGHAAPHEQRWAGINTPGADENRHILTTIFNRPEVIEAGIEQEVFGAENPWMITANFTEELVGNALRNANTMNWFRTDQHLQQMERFVRETFGAYTAGASPGSDQSTPRPTYAQPSESQQTTPRQ